VRAVWSSGDPTEAISGAGFLTGSQWHSLDGAFVVAALKGSKLLAMTMDPAGAVTAVVEPPELRGTHGRLRSVHQGPDGALYLTTDNGSNRDEVLRVTPTHP
ncbi:MAG: PQQ-dependent sugar dehydrogenase, partial [Mycobacteriaceae bacterium]